LINEKKDKLLTDKEKNQPKYKIFRHKFTGEKSRTENIEQMACTAWLNYHFPELNWFHVPNEGLRSASYADKMKRCGLKSGVSDFIIMKPINEYHGAVIELKREDGLPSNVSKEQNHFLENCYNSGYYAAVTFGVEEFKRSVCDYLCAPID
jgi:hypothetical protein